eukprot:TRINITY_DN3645_c0_g1_i8.p1 TRINITY_DN3645_c0_g1~~TRINITY_DN3645_c0_g1_i8.p1  ORF type:complete len:194 (-),score=3.87 TRINITY_DN3645_c0_g1_i8:52-633(-)
MYCFISKLIMRAAAVDREAMCHIWADNRQAWNAKLLNRMRADHRIKATTTHSMPQTCFFKMVYPLLVEDLNSPITCEASHSQFNAYFRFMDWKFTVKKKITNYDLFIKIFGTTALQKNWQCGSSRGKIALDISKDYPVLLKYNIQKQELSIRYNYIVWRLSQDSKRIFLYAQHYVCTKKRRLQDVPVIVLKEN